MRNKVILVLVGALVLQCCCISSLTPQLEEIAGEIEQQLTLEVPLEMLPTLETLPTEAPLLPQPSTAPVIEEDPNAGMDAITGSSSYRVQQTLRIANEGSGTVDELKLHMALIKDWKPYQVVSLKQVTPVDFETFTDEYGNQYALFWLYDIQPGESVPINIEYEVTVNALDYDLRDCSGEMLDGFTYAEDYLEVDDNAISSQSYVLMQNVVTYCQGARNIYDYVIDSMNYSGYVTGDRGALAAMQSGSGDCTEYADLMIALSRASGVPARFIEGVTYSRDGFYDEGQTKHDWLEVFLPGSGWVPMDPTWGENNPDTYFAGLSSDHIIVTKGRNLEPLSNHHFWAYWWWGDEGVKVSTYDEAWKIWKQ